ncbi:MAG: carboxypeptidase regulatory-like domain-containing protein, partial [bacterium]|nr:carboxypeptidase regulatory-like domain-containing protein [bacterium]
KTNAVYWLEMQSNKDLNAAYEKARGKQKGLSLHIPVCNRLPGTEKELLVAYETMMVKVAARWNGKMSTPPDTGAPKVAMPRIPFPASAGIAAALVALLLISWWFFFPTKPGPSHQSPKTDIAAPKRITVKGTIVDNTGMPVRGAKVTLFLEDAKNPFADDNSNSDGNFRFTGVPFKKDKLSRVKVTLNGRDVHDELFTLPGPLKIVL